MQEPSEIPTSKKVANDLCAALETHQAKKQLTGFLLAESLSLSMKCIAALPKT